MVLVELGHAVENGAFHWSAILLRRLFGGGEVKVS